MSPLCQKKEKMFSFCFYYVWYNFDKSENATAHYALKILVSRRQKLFVCNLMVALHLREQEVNVTLIAVINAANIHSMLSFLEYIKQHMLKSSFVWIHETRQQARIVYVKLTHETNVLFIIDNHQNHIIYKFGKAHTLLFF